MKPSTVAKGFPFLVLFFNNILKLPQNTEINQGKTLWHNI